MLNRLILKVTKFQLPPRKRFGTAVKKNLGGIMASPQYQIGLIQSRASAQADQASELFTCNYSMFHVT